MALRTPAAPSTSAPPVKSTVPTEDTVLLTLALYRNYTWSGRVFEKGKAYKFAKADAMQLLSEMDHGRQIWHVYKPIQVKAAPKDVVVDATAMVIPQDADPIHGLETVTRTAKRIDVGTDDEIADILDRVDSDGDVTV